jgi:hypothetical protein
MPKVFFQHVSKLLGRYFHRSFTKYVKSHPAFCRRRSLFSEILHKRIFSQIAERPSLLCRFPFDEPHGVLFDNYPDSPLHISYSSNRVANDVARVYQYAWDVSNLKPAFFLHPAYRPLLELSLPLGDGESSSCSHLTADDITSKKQSLQLF